MMKFKTQVIIICLMALSALTWAVQHRYFKVSEVPQKVVVPLAAPFKYDKALMLRFEKLCEKYDTLKTNLTMLGSITMIDRADSSSMMNNVHFVFCKKGNDLYYKLGKTETINENGLYLYVDHGARKIILSQQKPVNYMGKMQPIAKMADMLKSESYQMSGTIKGDQQTISFINERHVSCKQFTVTFDTVAFRINHVYSRLTNFYDPLNKNKEKILDVHLSKWGSEAVMDNYTLPLTVVKKRGNDWITTKLYENYQLIYR